MQAILLLSIYALFASLVAGIIVSGSKNIEQLQRLYQTQTEALFQNIADVTQNDLTPTNLQAMVAPGSGTNITTWLTSTTQLNALNLNGAFPASDAWRRPITGAASVEQRELNRTALGSVQAPVTAVALISGGPNGVLEAGLTARLASIISFTNVNVMGLESYRSGDDIILTFTDEAAQQRTWQAIKAYVDRIGQAALKHYQGQLKAYQAQLGSAYTANLTTGTAPSLTVQLSTDPNAPRFLDLNNTNNIAALGVMEDYVKLTETRPDNSRFGVSATISANAQTLTLTLNNDTAGGRPSTPWANLSYTLRLTGAIK
jgi:hypothetical protein